MVGSQTVTRYVTAVFADNSINDDDDDGLVGVIENLANPDEAQVEVPEDDYVVTISPAGSDTLVFGPVEVDLEDDTSHIFCAVGCLDDGSFTLLKQEIELEELDEDADEEVDEETDEETDADTGTLIRTSLR